MAFSPAYRAEVEEKLSKLVVLRTKAMFGGVGLYAGNHFFALIAEDKLYFKVGDLNRPDFEAAGMGPFYPFDAPKPMGYYELPPGLIDRPTELKSWIDKSIAVAESAKRKK